jgi:hypothetical protein
MFSYVSGNPIRLSDTSGTDGQDQTNTTLPSQLPYQATGPQLNKDTITVLGAVGKAAWPEIQKVPFVEEQLDKKKTEFSKLAKNPADLTAAVVGGVALVGVATGGLIVAGDQKLLGVTARSLGVGGLSLVGNLVLDKLTDGKISVSASNTPADGTKKEETKIALGINSSRGGSGNPGTALSLKATIGSTPSGEFGLHKTVSSGGATIKYGFTETLSVGKPPSTTIDASIRFLTPIGKAELAGQLFLNKTADKPGLNLPNKINDVGGPASFGFGPHLSGSGVSATLTLWL